VSAKTRRAIAAPRSKIDVDTATKIGRARMDLWKALIVASNHAKSNNTEAAQFYDIIDEVLMDYRCNLL
jgi:hypothetical protein